MILPLLVELRAPERRVREVADVESELHLRSRRRGLSRWIPMKKQKGEKKGRCMSLKRVGRAQYSRFGSTMQARGVSSVWESAGFASRRSPVRSRYAPLEKSCKRAHGVGCLVDAAKPLLSLC